MKPTALSLERIFPILKAAREYRRGWWRADLLAGLSVCAVMVPTVIAYAQLIGVTPEHGLHAALAGMIAYVLFASSRRVIVGPDAAICLLVATAIAPLARHDSSRAAALAAAFAMLAGLLLWIAATVRIGAVADLLSKPVLIGYTCGAALILVGTQLGRFTGIALKRTDFFPRLLELGGRWHEAHLLTLGLGLGLLALQGTVARFAPRVPGAVVVFVAGLVISQSFHLSALGLPVVGDLPGGLPGPVLPDVSLAEIKAMLPGAIGVALLTFSEGILLARAFAAKHQEEVEANQELAALGTANLASGLFQGFSVGASQSRTTVNDTAGARTQFAGLVAAALLGVFQIWLLPFVRELPLVALAAMLVFAGLRLIELEPLRELWQVSHKAFALAVLTAFGVLLVGVVPGILFGVMISLIHLISKLSRPEDAVLREVPGTGEFHDLGPTTEIPAVPGLIAYRFYAPLLFSNASYFCHRVRELIAASPTPVRWFLLDAQAITDVDVTAAEALHRLHKEMRAQGIALKVARAKRPLRETLARVGLKGYLGEDSFFPSVHDGVRAFQSVKPEGAPQAGESPTT